MITIEECRKELTNNGNKHTDEEITMIRDFFTQMSQLIIKTIKVNSDEKSNSVRQGIDQ